MRSAATLLSALALLSAPLGAQWQPGELFDRTVSVLEARYYDEVFRREALPALARSYRTAAVAAESRAEERAVVHALLARIPASHLALYSESTWRDLLGELDREVAPTLGLRLQQDGGRFFAVQVLEGGPAARAGVLRGDRIVTVDGVPVGRSPRVDWRSDDAALSDPPSHGLLAGDGERVALEIERRPGETAIVEVECAEYSAWQATLASVEVMEHRGNRIGYLRLHYVYSAGGSALVRSVLAGEFADCDGWILDLRGRGGSASETTALARALERARREGAPPLVAVTDSETRSGKEVLAFRIRRDGLGVLVGERTAGAVLPASFARVGDDEVLMFPARELARYSEAIEGEGVAPDVPAADRLAYAGGRDPLLAAALGVFPAAEGGAGERR